jgi:hypothetical protein
MKSNSLSNLHNELPVCKAKAVPRRKAETCEEKLTLKYLVIFRHAFSTQLKRVLFTRCMKLFITNRLNVISNKNKGKI